MQKAKSSSAYKGTVTVKIKNKNKVKKVVKGKNTGCKLLFRSIALALAGYALQDNVPTYMTIVNEDNNHKPNYSAYSLPVPVTGRSFGQDSNGDWFCRITATIPKANFRTDWTTTPYYAVLLNGKTTSTVSEEVNVLAYIKLENKETTPVTPIDILQMENGSSLVIEWNLYVQNYETIKEREESAQQAQNNS